MVHVALSDPRCPSTCSFDEVVRNRRSIRSFASTPLSFDDLSDLLWATTGIHRREHGFAFRTAPSAGALYPIETYLIINHVKGVDPGVYHYDIQHHWLEQLKKGDFRVHIAAAALDQDMCAHAAVVFVWTAVFNRSKCKYGQRAYRYIYLDAGHIAENLALGAVSIGLGSCQVAALYDDEVNRLIEVNGTEESVLYLSVVGVPK